MISSNTMDSNEMNAFGHSHATGNSDQMKPMGNTSQWTGKTNGPLKTSMNMWPMHYYAPGIVRRPSSSCRTADIDCDIYVDSINKDNCDLIRPQQVSFDLVSINEEDEARKLFNKQVQVSNSVHRLNQHLLKLLHEEWAITGQVPDGYEALCYELGLNKSFLKNTSYPLSHKLIHRVNTISPRKGKVDSTKSENLSTNSSDNLKRSLFDCQSIPRDELDMSFTESSEFGYPSLSIITQTDNLFDSSMMLDYVDSNSIEMDDLAKCSTHPDDNGLHSFDLAERHMTTTKSFANHPIMSSSHWNENNCAGDDGEENLERAAYEIELKRLEVDFAVISHLYSVHKQRAKETKREAYRIAYKSNSKKLKDITQQINQIRSLLVNKDTSKPSDDTTFESNKLSRIQAHRHSSWNPSKWILTTLPRSTLKGSHTKSRPINQSASKVTSQRIDGWTPNESSLSCSTTIDSSRERPTSLMPFLNLFHKQNKSCIASPHPMTKSEIVSNPTPSFDSQLLLHSSDSHPTDLGYDLYSTSNKQMAYQKTNCTVASSSCGVDYRGQSQTTVGRQKRTHSVPKRLSHPLQVGVFDMTSRVRSLPDLNCSNLFDNNTSTKLVTNNKKRYYTSPADVSIVDRSKQKTLTAQSSGIGLGSSFQSVTSTGQTDRPTGLKHIPKKATASNTSSSNWSSSSGCSEMSTTQANSFLSADHHSPSGRPGANKHDLETPTATTNLTTMCYADDDDDDGIEKDHTDGNDEDYSKARLRKPNKRGRRLAMQTAKNNCLDPFGINITAKCICSCFSEYGFNSLKAIDQLGCNCCAEPVSHNKAMPTSMSQSVHIDCLGSQTDLNCPVKPTRIQQSGGRLSLKPFAFFKQAVNKVASHSSGRRSISTPNANASSNASAGSKAKRMTGPTILPQLMTDKQLKLVKSNSQQASAGQSDSKLSWTSRVRYSTRLGKRW